MRFFTSARSPRIAHLAALTLATLTLAATTTSAAWAQTQLGKIAVEGVADESETTDTYSAPAVSVGGKTARDPRDVPQSVTVVTQQRIRDQNLTSVTEALGQATGIAIANDNYVSIYSRGLQINSLQFDGGAPSVINNYGDYSALPDIATFDRVEVLRGSDGLFSGAGEAGGTVNLARKRPLDRPQILIDAMAGRWDRYRAQIDATGPLAWEGALRGRVVAAVENRNFFYETNDKSNKTVLYGILEGDIGSSTVLTVGGRYEKLETPQNYMGLPRFSNGDNLNLPRDTCICVNWARFDGRTSEAFAKVEQSLGENWSLKANVSQQHRRIDSPDAFSFGGVDPFTQSGPFLLGTHTQYSPRQRLADVTLNGKFSIAGFEQELLVGANWQDADGGSYRQSLLYTSFPQVNVPQFDPADFPRPADPPFWGSVYSALGQKQHGVFLSLRSALTQRLHSIVGARYSNYRYASTFDSFDTQTGDLLGSSDLRFRESDELTPYAGLSYDINDTITAYASFAQIFQPQGSLVTVTGEPLKPIEGNSMEIGAKGAWLQGALTASVAAYKIERKNAGLEVAGVGNFGQLACCYIAAAKVESKGFDAEITGRVRQGWDVFAGYTYNTNRNVSGYGDSDGTAYFPQMPKHLLKVWTMAQVPGLSAVKVGGGVNVQSKIFVAGSATTYDSTGNATGAVPFRFTQGGYALVSLRGEYQLNDTWLAGLNLNNAFDRTYYQTVGSSGGRNFYGEPRNVTLSLSSRW